MVDYKNGISILLLMWNTLAVAQNGIPFQLANKLIVVRGVVDGKPGNYILDTGISNLVLNARYFTGRPSEKVYYGLNGRAGKLAINYSSVHIGDHLLKKVYAEIIPLPTLEAKLGIPIHGLLGTSVFRKSILAIDFQQREVLLYPSDQRETGSRTARGRAPADTLVFKYKGGTPLIKLYAGGVELKVTVDTGAEINLLDNQHLEKFADLLVQRRKKRIGGFGQSAQETTFGRLSGLHTDSVDLAVMNTAFIDLAHFNRSVDGLDADGIVGYEFLRQFRVAINFRKERYTCGKMKLLLKVMKQ